MANIDKNPYPYKLLMSKDVLIRQSVKAVIHTDKRLLLQLRDDKHDIFFPGCWGLFGGSIDDEENPLETLIRELAEEICLDVKKAQFLFSWKHKKYSSLLHFFSIQLTVDISDLCLREGQAMDLFSIKQIKSLTITPDLAKNLKRIEEEMRKIYT